MTSTEVVEPFATPTTAQPTPGLAVGEGHFYSDGFRPGDFKCCFGVLEELLAINPGWLLADGTPTLPDGSQPPDMRDRFIVGAGTTYPVGGLGGSDVVAGHDHDFEDPAAHGDHALGPNHTGAAVAAHTNHTGNQVEVTVGVGSGFWVNVYTTAALAIAGLVHTAHSVTQPTAHTTPVTHDHNHDGGNVVPSAGGDSSLPPYAALYILVKVS